MKIFPVRAELFHADRQRERPDEENSSFLKFSERACNDIYYIWRPSPYRAVNKLRLDYKNQPVNVV